MLQNSSKTPSAQKYLANLRRIVPSKQIWEVTYPQACGRYNCYYVHAKSPWLHSDVHQLTLCRSSRHAKRCVWPRSASFPNKRRSTSKSMFQLHAHFPDSTNLDETYVQASKNKTHAQIMLHSEVLPTLTGRAVKEARRQKVLDRNQCNNIPR